MPSKPSPATAQRRAHASGARVGVSRAARVGAPARRRRGDLHRRHARARRHAARRARPVAGRARRACSAHRPRRACARCPAWSRCFTAHGHPRRQRLRPDRPRRPDPRRRRSCSTSASRCSPWSPTTHDAARRAARQAQDVSTIEPLPPILTPQEAHARRAVRAAADAPGARRRAARAIDAAPHRLQGELEVGGQEQFYLEGQIAYAVPQEDGGMQVHCSTQHPSEMQHLVAHALGTARRTTCRCECRRMGGGFGGKESQSALFACVAAVAARRAAAPGQAARSTATTTSWSPASATASSTSTKSASTTTGRILGARSTMVSRAGFSADLSGPVRRARVCHFDNAYCLSDVDIPRYCGKTNTQINTAFRGFGGPQGAIAIEYMIDDDRARARPRSARRARAPTSTAIDRAQRHAVRPEGRGQRHPRAGRPSWTRAATTARGARRSRRSTRRARC